jgi:hypothetical protein
MSISSIKLGLSSSKADYPFFLFLSNVYVIGFKKITASSDPIESILSASLCLHKNSSERKLTRNGEVARG